jgi:hypothetical protein
MPPTRSPFQIKELAFQTRFAAELLKAYNAFMGTVPRIEAMVQEARTLAQEARNQLARVQNLPKGEKGDSVRGPQGPQGKEGREGYSPIKGKDYFTESEILEVAKRAATFVLTPEDGKDAEIDYDTVVKMVYEKMKEEGYLMEEITGVRNEVASYRSQLAGKIYGKNTWARGAGDTIAAGTNITITTDEDGNKVISAQGGTGGAQIATETVTATDAGGNNVNIDLTQLANAWTSIELVIRNGVIQNQSKWSIVGDTLTLTGAVSTNDFQIQYVYA